MIPAAAGGRRYDAASIRLPAVSHFQNLKAAIDRTQSKAKESSLGAFTLECVRSIAALRFSDALSAMRPIFHARADNQRSN